MATQNPIEFEGTFPLPEAQLDRFLLKAHIDYPERDEEIQILERFRESDPLEQLDAVTTPDDITKLQQAHAALQGRLYTVAGWPRLIDLNLGNMGVLWRELKPAITSRAWRYGPFEGPSSPQLCWSSLIDGMI